MMMCGVYELLGMIVALVMHSQPLSRLLSQGKTRNYTGVRKVSFETFSEQCVETQDCNYGIGIRINS